MARALCLVLIVFTLISITWAQQDGRCDVTRQVLTYTACRECFVNELFSCPSGTVQTSTGQGIADCTYRFFFFIRSGCRHSCLTTVVTEERCCDGYWGTNCDPCPGVNGATGECNGHGNCSSGIDGDGLCTCEDSFNGTNCELCSEEDVFGPDCDSVCTCANGECNNGPSGDGHCQPDTCEIGFVGEDCDLEINTTACMNTTCDENGYCVEDFDGNVTCRCIPDYHFNPSDGIGCIAIDHCELDTHNCDGNATCYFTEPNQYNCTCDDGFTGDGVFCEAIDLCQTDNGGCEENSSCIYEGPGMATCECLEGYENTSFSCSPINPCEDGTANCSALANCSYVGPGIARCICPSGYILSSDGECYGSLLERLVDINDFTDYNLTTFLSLIEEQRLDDLLDRGGIFTVFAPTDAAFEQTTLMYDETITLLAHIIPAEVTAVVSTPTNYITLAGHVVEITPSNTYTIMDSTVSAGIIESDQLAFNGFINILDNVSIIPESARPFNISTDTTSAWGFINTWDRLSAFSSLIQLANMIEDFGLSDDITVLAPTNEAFQALEPGAIAYLQSFNGIDDLVTIISNHLVNEEISITDLVMLRTLETANNNSYPITLNANGSISLGAVKLVINNIAVSNGVVHIIDAVLKPPELDPIVNRTCPIIREDTFATACGSCINTPDCPPQYETSNFGLCFYFLFIGCRRICSRTIVTPQCCPGFYGTGCLPCPENHANPCNGNGQCRDRIDGDGTCMCNDGFNGTTCELCTEPDRFGINCTENCTCINGICDAGPMGSGQCIPGSCDEGFIGDDCDVGIPHCGILNSTCHLRATCQLINNNSTETCTCRRGYRGDGIFSCQPINPCEDPDRGGCHNQATCTYDGPGESTCTCNPGWSGDGTSCVVIDPCALPSRGGCDANAVCRYSAPGENTCTCNFGYRGDGTSCTAINSCQIDRGNCHPQATCIYTGPGINNCTCNSGYIGDGYNCIGDLLTEIGNNPNVSMFYRLLQQSHLEALLSQSDDNINYTMFVPSNVAIANASAEQLAVWTEEHALPLLIQHHLVDIEYSLDNLANHNGSLPTLLADDVLTVTVFPVKIVHINTAEIVIPNIFAQNGIYHIVDKVLFPNEAHLPTELPSVVDLLSNLSDYTTLIELINQFNLTNVLNGNTFTILAPTDDAFSVLSEEEFSNLTVNDLLYHIYPGSLPVETIYKGLQLYSQLANAGLLTFDIDRNSTITVNGVPLLGDDYHASNSSVVLPIAGVLQPIFNRCDIRNTSIVYGICGSCFRARRCPAGSTFLEIDRTCTYSLFIFGLVLRLPGCRYKCEQVDITPRCCDDFYGPDCNACPQVDEDICSGRGSCNDTVIGDGQCSCVGNYSGTACETCLPDHYGEDCDQVCSCSSNGYCNEGVDGDGSCFCSPGWQGDRCDILVNSTICNSTCHEFAYCVEADGTCVCTEGYTGNGTYCSVIDACINNGGCNSMATCLSDPFAPGGRTCTCQPERYTGDGVVCLPLDPCIAANNGGCDPNANCIMTGPGLRVCACNNGYTGDGVRSCDPINACENMVNGGCGANAYCVPTGPAQMKCICNENYVGDGYTCSGTLRQVITTHPSLTLLNSYMNQLNSYRRPIGRFLNNDGVFTGFVTSDAGYQALMVSASNDTLDLFSNPDALEKLIQYSFVGCTVLSTELLQNVSTLTSLMGSSLRVTNSSSGVTVNNANISVENIFAANGIIHIIDTAIMPPSADLVVGDASDSLTAVLGPNGFTYLQRGLQLAGPAVAQELFNPSQDPFTIFAPIDDAFDQQLLNFFTGLFQPSSRPRLLNFVRYHMTSGAMLSPSDLSNITHLVTVQGGVVRIRCNRGDLFVNGNRIVMRQIPFNLGVIYGIDGILRPPGEGGDCDVPTTLSTWTNCSGSCSLDCPGGYTPVSNDTSQQDCTLPDGITGCRQLCIQSAFERRCCDNYYYTINTGQCVSVTTTSSSLSTTNVIVTSTTTSSPSPTMSSSSTTVSSPSTMSSSSTTASSPSPTMSSSSSSTMSSSSSSSTGTTSTTTSTISSVTLTQTSLFSSPDVSSMSSSSMISSVMTSSIMPSSIMPSSTTASSMSVSVSLASTSSSSSTVTSSPTSRSIDTFSISRVISTTGSVSRSSSTITMPSLTTTSGLSTISNTVRVVQTPGASESQRSNNTGVAVGASVGVVALIVIVIIIIVIGVYMYSRKRGYLSFKDRMTYKTNEDGVILTMDSPSPTAFNNPIYSGEGDDSFYESGDDYLTNPIYDGLDDEV